MLDRIKSGHIEELATDKLFALQNPMLLDGRVSSYPASATGYSVTNCYLLRQPDAAWLIDTGFGGDEPALRAQIETLIPRTLPLSLRMTRATSRISGPIPVFGSVGSPTLIRASAPVSAVTTSSYTLRSAMMRVGSAHP